MKKYLAKIAVMTIQKIFIFAAVLAFLYYKMLFDDGSMLDQQIQQIAQQVTEEEGKLKKSKEALEKVEQIRAQVASLSDQFKLISTQMPTEFQMSEVLRTIDSMAATSGISVKTKEPQKPEVKDILEHMPLRVLSEGRFSELTLFLYNMMNTERISTIQSLSIFRNPLDRDNKRKVRSLFMDVKLTNYRFLGDEKKEDKK
jgi:Tfp pilus assembly protein PilO